MQLTYKYRLKPTKAQLATINVLKYVARETR
ncbi:helix-turn-helix domain-containing protein [Microcoleus sp.]